jgi:hypothetical protein
MIFSLISGPALQGAIASLALSCVRTGRLCLWRAREVSPRAVSAMAEDRLASAKEENAKLRETLTSKDREIFLLKVRFVCRSIRSLSGHTIRAAP